MQNNLKSRRAILAIIAASTLIAALSSWALMRFGGPFGLTWLALSVTIFLAGSLIWMTGVFFADMQDINDKRGLK